MKIPDIIRYTELVVDGEDVYCPGYYYVDETDRLNGPYVTLARARMALREFLKSGIL